MMFWLFPRAKAVVVRGAKSVLCSPRKINRLSRNMANPVIGKNMERIIESEKPR